MNGLSYPTSHQSSDDFTSQLCFPHFYLNFFRGANVRSSHESPDSFPASFPWTSNARSVSKLDAVHSFSLAFRLERSIKTDQPSMPLWPWNVQVAIFYPDRLMIAVHEVLPFPIQPQGFPSITLRKLSVFQKATFMVSQNGPEVSFLKTFLNPVYRDCRDDAKRRRLFLEHEPWLDVNRIEPDKVVCLGCGCDVSLGSVEYHAGNWMYHRNECVGIENVILSSVVDVLEIRTANASMRRS